MPVACFSDDSFCTPEGVCHILGVDMPIRKVLPNKAVRILSCLQRHMTASQNRRRVADDKFVQGAQECKTSV